MRTLSTNPTLFSFRSYKPQIRSPLCVPSRLSVGAVTQYLIVVARTHGLVFRRHEVDEVAAEKRRAHRHGRHDLLLNAAREFPVRGARVEPALPLGIEPQRDGRLSEFQIGARADFFVLERVERIPLHLTILVLVGPASRHAVVALQRIQLLHRRDPFGLDVAAHARLERGRAVAKQVIHDAEPGREVLPVHPIDFWNVPRGAHPARGPLFCS